MNQAPDLYGQKLLLRKPQQKDMADRLKIGRPVEFIRMCGGDTRNIEPFTEEVAKRWFEWVIEYEDKCIGTVRLTVNEQDNRGRYAIGIFDISKLGMGFGTETTKLVLDYAFNTLKLHRVDLKVLEYNKRAIACYSKCGFIKEGIEREGALIEGKWETDLLMSILENEYRKSSNNIDILLIKATESDADTMLIMQKECFKSHFEQYQDVETSPVNELIDKMLFRINYENGGYFKIIVDNIHAGCVRVYEKSPKLYRIGIIYILQEFQNKGIGQKALELAESLFPEAEAWELDCPADMPLNRKCYEKAGYRFTGKSDNINDKLTLVYYRKEVVHYPNVLREICYEELPQLLNLYKQLHPNDLDVHENELLSKLWNEIYNDPNLHYVVIEEDGELVATCNISIIKNLTRGLKPYGLIENVVTHEKYRKRGYGTKVLQKAIEIAKENNCYKVMLMTSSKSEDTLRFYEKAGFSRGIKTGYIVNL